MFKIKEITNKIILTQGDSCEFAVSLYDVNDNETPVLNSDILTFTVRDIDTDSVVIAKTAENAVFTLKPYDTKSLSAGLYHYDIQLERNTGEIYTIISNSYFQIEVEVSK